MRRLLLLLLVIRGSRVGLSRFTIRHGLLEWTTYAGQLFLKGASRAEAVGSTLFLPCAGACGHLWLGRRAFLLYEGDSVWVSCHAPGHVL